MMISRSWSRKSIAFFVAVAVLSVYSMVALASPGQKAMSGELSVSGQVTVNGQTAISGATVFSGSVIVTAANSTATISLGKTGRVDLLPNTSAKINFSDSNISASLDAGRVGISTPSGVSAIVTTRDGAAVADAGGAASFTVDVAHGNTVVACQTGHVDLRAGQKTTQIAAGSAGTAGTAQPGKDPDPDSDEGGIHGGALAALLLAIGGGAAGVLYALFHKNDLNFGGTVNVVSPQR